MMSGAQFSVILFIKKFDTKIVLSVYTVSCLGLNSKHDEYVHFRLFPVKL